MLSIVASRLAIARYGKKYADHGQSDYHGSAAVADERQCDTGNRQKTGSNHHIDHSLGTNFTGNTDGQETTEHCFRRQGRFEAVVTKDGEKRNEQSTANQTKLFGNYGKNKVGKLHRQVIKLLQRTTEALPPEPPPNKTIPPLLNTEDR